MTRADPLRPLA